MRALFDGRIFQLQRAGGINRYFAEIMGHLPDDWELIVSGANSLGSNAPQHVNLQRAVPPCFRPNRLANLYRRYWWCPQFARSFDLLHPTYYDLTCGLTLTQFVCPVVVTVYDLIYALFPAQMRGPEVVAQQRKAVKRADKVICISHSTEADLLKMFPESEGKTQVIHLGCSFAVAENSTPDWEIPTFLFVGSRAGYKNFSFLLRAFSRAASTMKRLRLHIVGPPLDSKELWDIHLLGLADNVLATVYPEEDELRALYRSSVGLLYPSYYEGFGLPPLEAMASGTVVVASNTSSLPEIIGDGGILLDPFDEDAWTDSMLKLAQPFSGRQELIERGRRRCKGFSWAETAKKHLEVYRSLL